MTQKKKPPEPSDEKGQADLRYEAWTTEGQPVVDDLPDQPRVRVRSIKGVDLGHYPTGPHNAITDVAGVRVGHSTVSHGEGKLDVGKGPARTGVTAIVPPGNVFMDRLAAAGWVLNGAGEMTGLTQVNEWGLLETPIVLTNTLAVGTASDAVVQWMLKQNPGIGREHDTVLPVVAECDDSWLSDIGGRHVKFEHVFAALDKAKSGKVPEGNVGCGTGMITFDFAGGTGTSSRVLQYRGGDGDFTIGALVQSNFGRCADLRFAGTNVGRDLEKLAELKKIPKRGGVAGSIICVVATDAPLTAHQLGRVCKRAALGIGRTGSYAGHASGEIIIAFSTANRFPRANAERVLNIKALSDEHIDPVFRATIECVEEAILNAICMADDQMGINNHFAPAIPLDKVRELLR